MTDTPQVKPGDPLGELPTAKEIMQQIALREAEKASAAARERTAAEAEKQALLERLSKPSGVSDTDRLARATAIIKRAAGNGLTEGRGRTLPQPTLHRPRPRHQSDGAGVGEYPHRIAKGAA